MTTNAKVTEKAARRKLNLLELAQELDHVSGSHYIMHKKGFPPLSVPVHAGRDIPKGTLHAILKQAGIS